MMIQKGLEDQQYAFKPGSPYALSDSNSHDGEVSGSTSVYSHNNNNNNSNSSTEFKVYVRNLSPKTTAEEVRAFFEKFGDVAETYTHTEKAGTGYAAYVRFNESDAVDRAVKLATGSRSFISGSAPDTKPLLVRKAESLESRNRRLIRKAEQAAARLNTQQLALTEKQQQGHHQQQQQQQQQLQPEIEQHHRGLVAQRLVAVTQLPQWPQMISQQLPTTSLSGPMFFPQPQVQQCSQQTQCGTAPGQLFFVNNSLLPQAPSTEQQFVLLNGNIVASSSAQQQPVQTQLVPIVVSSVSQPGVPSFAQTVGYPQQNFVHTATIPQSLAFGVAL